jgi:hypothetical protein
MELKRKTGLILSLALLMIPATAALAKPVSTTTVDLIYADGTLSLTYGDLGVVSLSATLECASNTNTESWTVSNIATPSVAEGRASNPTWIDVEATNVLHAGCDGTETILPAVRFAVMMVDEGRVQRHRSANGDRVLMTPVSGNVYLPVSTVVASGTSTETISR